MSQLALYLLGSPRLEREGVPLQLQYHKNLALVAYLAVAGMDQGAESHTREALVTLLWPELDPSRARAGLRRNLSVLRKALGDQWLVVDRELVGLDPAADVWFDVAQFRGRLRFAQAHDHPQADACPECLSMLAEAVELYRGDFMAGFSLRDSPSFDDWQFFQTEELRHELAWALERLVVGHSAQEAYAPALTHARRWLALDPLREPVHRHLMRLYVWSGQRAAALRQYAECTRLLSEELGAPPDEATRQLYEAIKGKQRLPRPERHAPPPIVRRAFPLHQRFRLDAELGRGGMGVTYRAHDTLLDRDVAVKVVNDPNLGETARAKILHEARAAARLNHPNIVTVFDAGEAFPAAPPAAADQAVPFIVMELVEGGSLQDLKLAGDPRLDDLSEITRIARQICAALAHAHGHGIVHRDLKPENVLLTPDGQAKLSDFGLARSVASRLTSEGTIIGTVFYLAPELALRQTFDGRADLYALGVMLYELTTGRLPFAADDPVAVISQHLHAPIVPPSVKNPAIPPRLDDLIQRLLSKDPADRPSSAPDVLRILDASDLLSMEVAAADEVSVLARIERGRMVGRDRELQTARAVWNQVLSGQGQTLLVSGEPGIGKTRLVRELVTQVQVSGGKALVGACYAEGGVPYTAIAQIVRRALDVDPGDERDGSTHLCGAGELAKVLPEFVLADLLTLAPALRLRFPEVAPNPPLDDPRAEQHRLAESLVHFVAALSDGAPLMLVLEDAHWADSGTLFLLRHLARRTSRRRVMLVATYREVELDAALPFHELLLDLQRERLATRLKLTRLNREGTEQLLAILFDEEITPEFLDGIYRETEGNPFFIEEVCKALVESGQVYIRDGRWGRPSMEEIGIPQSVRVAVQSRVQVLPLEAQETLRLAAVLGREFSFRTLAKAWDPPAGQRGEAVEPSGQGLGEETLLEALDDAERAQLIERVSGEAGGIFTFAHGLIPSTLVESTRSLQRRRLHLRVAAAIEALHPDDGTHWDALAFHYSEAGEGEKAAEYLLKAGERARGLYANQEAIDHYRQALALLDEPGLMQLHRDWRLKALYGLGRLHLWMGDTEEAAVYLQRAISLGEELGLEPRELVRIYHWLGEAFYWSNRYDDMIRCGEQGMALLAGDAVAPAESTEAALMNQTMAAGHSLKGDRERSREITFRTAGFIERLPYSKELRPAFVHIVAAYGSQRDEDEAEKWLDIFEQRATEHHHLRGLLEVHFARGDGSAWTGDYLEAIRCFQQGVELADRIGDFPHGGVCLFGTGWAWLALGNLEKAHEFGGRALGAFKAAAGKFEVACGYVLVGQVALVRGEWKTAEAGFQESVRLFREVGRGWEEAWATCHLGETALAQGIKDEAARHFQETLSLLGPEGLTGHLAPHLLVRTLHMPLVAKALSGLERASEDPAAFRALCDRYRETADGPFKQWYLQPATVGPARRSPLQHDLSVAPLSPAWSWGDPFGDCSYTTADGLEIHAANGRDLRFTNLSAPRLLRSASGDWAIQAVCAPVSGPPHDGRPCLGGLLLWKDRDNFLRLDRGVTDENGVLFSGCLENRDILVGRGRLVSRDARVSLRLERVGDQVRALCSADGQGWFSVGQIGFSAEDPVQVGLHVIGNIDRTVYRGAYPEGAAIRFESFQLWGQIAAPI